MDKEGKEVIEILKKALNKKEEENRKLADCIEKNYKDSIPKDKIREKIEELRNSREFYENFPDDYMAEISINILEELLEEE